MVIRREIWACFTHFIMKKDAKSLQLWTQLETNTDVINYHKRCNPPPPQLLTAAAPQCEEKSRRFQRALHPGDLPESPAASPAVRCPVAPRGKRWRTVVPEEVGG